MPTNSKVHRCYQKVVKHKSPSSAAKICQHATGQALSTGKPPRYKKK